MKQKPLDIEKLAKVLQLSTSPVDHEALAAIRTANKMLEARGMMWTDLLQRAIEPV